jgi:hypothetical protein
MIREYLEVWGRNVAGRVRIVTYESLFRQTSLERGTWLLSSLDELGPTGERVLIEMYGRLEQRGGVRILNHPIRTLKRFELLTELRRLDWNEFRAVRAIDDLEHLRYPVFLREERSHQGAMSDLLHSPDEVEARIGLALVQGYRLRDLLVIEFCDTADENGFYRKFAAFVVGKRVVARSLNYGRQWMLKHHGTEFSRAMVLEERDYVTQNPHEGELARIFDVAGVEYGRIDYAIKDGRVQTWEINLNPTIGRGTRPSRGAAPLEVEPIRTETKRHFYSEFQRAWESIDLAADDQPIATEPEDRAIGAQPRREALSGRRLGALRAMLRPARPLLEPLAKPFFPLLGRLARRSAAARRG